MRILLVIAMALLAGCAGRYVPTDQRVINIDAPKQKQECYCPPVPVCEEERGMRWKTNQSLQ